MRFLRTNTAVRVTVGPFFDKTDGVTPETAITVTNEKLTLMVDDANVPTLVLDTAPTASGGNNDMVHVTGDDAGFYDLELTAANTNYLGRAMLALTDAATHCPVFHEFMILPANIYDSFVLGTANQKVDVDTIKTNPVVNGGTVTFPSNATLASTAGAVGSVTGAVGSVTGLTASDVGAIKAKTDNLPPSPAAVGSAMTLTAAYDAAKTAATQASVDTIAGYVDTEVTAIKAKTDQLTFSVANTLDVNIEYVNGTQIDGSGTTGDPWGPV